MPKLKTFDSKTTPEMNFINQLHIAIVSGNWMNWEISHDGDGKSNSIVLTYTPTGQSIYLSSSAVCFPDDTAA